MRIIQIFDSELVALMRENADLLYPFFLGGQRPIITDEGTVIYIQDKKEPPAIMGSEDAIWVFRNVDYAMAWAAALSWGLRSEVRLANTSEEEMRIMAGDCAIEVLLPPKTKKEEE